MPRFGDRWVVDKTMFEYSMGGACACCGFNHFLPGGAKGAIEAMSDLETDAANAEKSALEKSPWPPDMRDAVWGDRLKLRYFMKKEMEHHSQFWEQHGEAFEEWCRNERTPTDLKKIFQMPRSEVPERVRTTYGIHGAFVVVLCTVVEQVANFELTQLPVDARGDSEAEFEEALMYDRRGGFTLDIKNKDASLNEEVLQIWLQRMKSLGGPKLLDRAPRIRTNSDSDDEGGDADDGLKKQDEDESETDGPSFRADRRIIRLLIARYWADQFQKKFLADLEKKKVQDSAESAQKEDKKEGSSVS